MVPLLGENRLFAKYGKIVLEKTRRKGLKKIIEKSRLNRQNITAGDIGFMIGPRINAASRLEHPMIAFEALAENNGDGVLAAEELEKINNRRKYAVAKIMKNV
jgi:single-stranded-DNA-specific exonuclease